MQTTDPQKSYIFVDYIPAQISFKKICRIYFYAKNPNTGKLQRVSIKCNRIKSRREKYNYAKLICQRINEKLQTGWNPFLEKIEINSQVTFSEAVKKFMIEHQKESRKDTIRSYKSFTHFFENWLINNEMINNYCFTFNGQHANKLLSFVYQNNKIGSLTYNNYLRFFRILFNFFILKGYIKNNPFLGFKLKRIEDKKREIIPPETRKFIKEYLFNNNMKEYYYLSQLCYRCFIRPKEILNLKIENIDYKNKMLTLTASISKTHRERVIGIPDEIFEYFLSIKNLKKELFIFSKKYKPGGILLNTKDVGYTWAKMRTELNLPTKYQFYSLKDTGITEMLDAGVPTKIVKELAGHSSFSMTEKYTHKTAASEILKYNKLEF